MNEDLIFEGIDPEQALMEEQGEAPVKPGKKHIRKDVGKMGWGLFLYSLVNYGVVILYVIVETVRILATVQDKILQEQRMAAIEEGGLSMIISVTVSVLILYRFMKKGFRDEEIFAEKKPVNVKVFLQLLSVFMGTQLIGSLLFEVLERALNAFGWTALSSMEAASSSSQTFSMLIYVSFVGPITEELTYRGIVLGTCKKYGKMFAIVFSALLFGLMHANIPQALYAFCVGLVLGYVAMEYSIKWSIILHVINNFVFSEILSIFGIVFGEIGVEILRAIAVYGFFFAGIFVFWKKRKQIGNYMKENKTEGNIYRYALTTVPIALFIVINLLLGIMMFEPIA